MEQPVQCLAWASCFVHSVCQASSGEIHLCLKNSPNGLNAILALAPLFFVARVPNVAADASRVPEGCACPAQWLVWGTASDSEQGSSWMPKVQVVRSPVGV